MIDSYKVAALQLDSGKDIEKNLQSCASLIEQAAACGARLVSTPENTDFIRARYQDKMSVACKQADHPAIEMGRTLAARHGIVLHLGSLTILNDDGTLSNRSYLFGPNGEIIAHYNKIHMFDVQLSNGEIYQESKAFKAGDKAVLVDTPLGKLGLTICYDLRFPHLYRHLAKLGVKIMFVPAAFTVPTGKAHWESLLRSRAIENGCYIVASAQTGSHEGEKDTYGHSLIINPWGEILADGGSSEGIIYADIDLAQVDTVRKSIPSLQHDRDYS